MQSTAMFQFAPPQQHLVALMLQAALGRDLRAEDSTGTHGSQRLSQPMVLMGGDNWIPLTSEARTVPRPSPSAPQHHVDILRLHDSSTYRPEEGGHVTDGTPVVDTSPAAFGHAVFRMDTPSHVQTILQPVHDASSHQQSEVDPFSPPTRVRPRSSPATVAGTRTPIKGLQPQHTLQPGATSASLPTHQLPYQRPKTGGRRHPGAPSYVAHPQTALMTRGKSFGATRRAKSELPQASAGHLPRGSAPTHRRSDKSGVTHLQQDDVVSGATRRPRAGRDTSQPAWQWTDAAAGAAAPSSAPHRKRSSGPAVMPDSLHTVSPWAGAGVGGHRRRSPSRSRPSFLALSGQPLVPAAAAPPALHGTHAASDEGTAAMAVARTAQQQAPDGGVVGVHGHHSVSGPRGNRNRVVTKPRVLKLHNKQPLKEMAARAQHPFLLLPNRLGHTARRGASGVVATGRHFVAPATGLGGQKRSIGRHLPGRRGVFSRTRRPPRPRTATHSSHLAAVASIERRHHHHHHHHSHHHHGISRFTQPGRAKRVDALENAVAGVDGTGRWSRDRGSHGRRVGEDALPVPDTTAHQLPPQMLGLDVDAAGLVHASALTRCPLGPAQRSPSLQELWRPRRGHK